MGTIKLLDCTLRDGGYINDWRFGKSAIIDTIRKLEQTGIEAIEVGFLKGNTYDPDRTVFPDVNSIKNVLFDKKATQSYVAMLDMSAPIPMDRITARAADTIDGIRVIFKKNKIDEAYVYCQYIKQMGYQVYVNFVGTDQYTDKEFIEGIERFNHLNPEGVTIVDTFGMIKRKEFMRFVALADHNLNPDAMLCYHAHNNLQQAFGNAEALVEMNLKRDIVIDACIFGMGRGAGNLNLELFAEYMNENHNKNYLIPPMLKIMDEYLAPFYRKKFWGYSLPLYLSATKGCHPNYAIYYAEKDTLPVKAFNELLQSIPANEKINFNKETAEKYYLQYLENYIDDSAVLSELERAIGKSDVLLVAPGESRFDFMEEINAVIAKENVTVMCVNFFSKELHPQFVFCGNMKRFAKLPSNTEAKVIVTSNVGNTEGKSADYVINFSSYISKNADIIDNAGLMALRLLCALGTKNVYVAGMDGYSAIESIDIGKKVPDEIAILKNRLISEELNEIRKHINIDFITPTNYSL